LSDPMPGIYCLKNIVNNKVYIGSSNDTNTRKRGHFHALRYHRHANRHLQNVFDKYGEECFEFSILEQVGKLELIEREQYWIDSYNSADREYGYNVIPFADRHAFSDDTRKRMSQSRNGIVFSDEHRRRLSEAATGKPGTMKGKHHSDETKRKMSEFRKGKPVPWAGKPLSDERKRQISERLVGKKMKPRSEETLRRMSEAQRGKIHSEETRRRMSEAHKHRRETSYVV